MCCTHVLPDIQRHQFDRLYKWRITYSSKVDCEIQQQYHKSTIATIASLSIVQVTQAAVPRRCDTAVSKEFLPKAGHDYKIVASNC